MLKTINGGYLIKSGVYGVKPRPNLSPYASHFLGPWGISPFLVSHIGFADKNP